ncbi:MAG TPA: hypothetical protein PKV85_05870 [Spirochaetota bacterium]|nr:hypothetical protein [Spirochaetota bacterium]
MFIALPASTIMTLSSGKISEAAAAFASLSAPAVELYMLVNPR